MKRDTRPMFWDTLREVIEWKGEISLVLPKWRPLQDSNPEPAD